MATGPLIFANQQEQPKPVITQSPENNITFFAADTEMLKVSESGFYVRGVRVEADAKEAENVYEAFKQWLVWHGLSR